MKIYRFRMISVENSTITASRFTSSALALVLSWAVCTPSSIVRAQNAKPATSSITLKGVSSGGTLTLMKAPALNYAYVSVTNSIGDSAVTVTERLADELRKHGAGLHGVLHTNDTATLVLGGGPIGVGAPCSSWILGGTERGMNIPPPPIAVSAAYDSISDRVTVRWENPSSGYDFVVIVYYSVPLIVLPGDSTHYVHQRQTHAVDAGFSPSDIPISVLGYKNGVPSNGVGVRIRNQTELEALMNVPFTDCLAPGFESWVHNTPVDAISFGQGNLPGMRDGADVRLFRGKGFFQALTSRGQGRGGIARRFIGLAPGHTYRVSARINIMEAGLANWGISFHAAAIPSGGPRLSETQMAGIAALPMGGKGPKAAQIARPEPGTTVRGQWVTLSSGTVGDDNPTGDVILPAGSDSVTVWFRLEGAGASETTVGIDSVKIEDLGEKQQ